MAQLRVAGHLLSCASVLALSAGTAFAHPAYYGCSSLTHPGTISKDKRCVEVRKTIEGDVVNNATIGKSWGYWGHYYSKSGFFVGRDITGELINNGRIYGLYIGADVEGGIVNNGKIVDLSLGYYSRHGLKEASLTGDIVNNGLIFGHDYAIAARYGTMSGALINDGAIVGGKVGVFIPDSFTAWTGGIVNSGLIYGGTSAIQIGGSTGYHCYWEELDGVVFSGGIRNETGGVLLSSFGPTIAVGGASFSGGITNDGLITQYLGEGGEHGEDLKSASPYQGVAIVFTAPTVEGGVTNGANGEIYGLKGPAIWITDKTQTFSGGITNHGTIAGANDAIRIESAAFAGGFANTGAIVAYEGDGVFATSAWTGDVQNDGLISGANNGFAYAGSTFDGNFANTGLIEAGVVAVSLSGTTFDGSFNNSGTLIGGATGLSMSFNAVTGGFTNSGAIGGEGGDGVAIDVGTWGAADARADIVNTSSGVIVGGDTGFLFEAGTVYGDFVNDGTIVGGGADTGAHIIAGTFVGDIDSNKLIASPYDAAVIDIDLFDGAFANTGTIAGGANGAVFELGTMTGGFTNSGTIAGETADGVTVTVETWGSEASPAEILNTVDGVIAGGETGFALAAGTLRGSFANEGLIQGGVNGASFTADNFDAPFASSGTILGGNDGVVMLLGEASGGFTNEGAIGGESGDGVDIVVTTWGATDARADIVNTVDGVIAGGERGFALDLVTLHGDVTNDGLITGGDVALALSGGTFDGAFSNTGTIAGGGTGVAFALDTVTGGFTNSGAIGGEGGDGVAIDVGTWGAVDARADIVNTSSGVIAGGDTGFLFEAGTVYGDFVNDGTIVGGGADTGAHIIAGTFVGDIDNNKLIASPYDAAVIDIDLFDGAFANTGTIAGGANGAVFELGTMTGGFTNSGTIAGETADGVTVTVETWGSEASPAEILNTVDGVIAGGETGFALAAGTLRGSFANEGLIQGGVNGASFKAENFDAPFANSGTILGGNDGVVMLLGEASGGFTNEGVIGGESGDGVDIVVTTWGAADARADIVNTVDGVIAGGERGFALDLVTLHGDVTNDGLITGGDVALALSGGTFDGAFSNTGTIAGGGTGVSFALATVTGGFTNSGAIGGEGSDGVAIDVGTWGAADARADIVNTSSGVIAGGDTGFLLEAGTVYGDFVNDGTIIGGGADTGAHIIAGTFVGDIDNNTLLQAPSNALHLEIEELDGEIRNVGTIATNDVAVRLAIGNGATFTNADGGIILGDVIFGGKASYAFVAEDGAIAGDLIGEGNADTITVEGTHVFVGQNGTGSANNFASFTVEDGGAALLGALFEGDTNGSGYVFNAVGALNVRDGGVLYIDKSTTLNVGSYTQEAGGVVEFFLGAPGGEGFSDLTGSVVAGADDYGRIIVEGAASLDGAVVGFLDPAFAEANDNLNEVLYQDVITATGGISGSFGTLGLIADSSLFELSQIIDGTTLDITVSRVSLTDIGGIGGIIVNTGGPFDALVSDRSNGIGSGSCGLAGDGWCFNRFAQNKSPGATQVMTDASPGEDPFAWLRTGVRKVGETAAWGRAVSVNGSTDGDANNAGTDFQVAGLIAGIDHVFSPIFMAGVAAQWTTTDIDFNGRADDAEVESFELGVYTSYGDTRLYLNANASVIFHGIEVNRVTKGGFAQADYDGTTLSAFAEVGKTFETYEGMRIQPFVAVSFSHLETDDYREVGTGALLSVSESTFDSLKSMVGLRLAYPVDLPSGRKLVPEARVAWVHEFMDDQASFLASVQGQARPPSRVFGEEYSRDTLAVGVGVNVPLSDSAAVFVDYDAGLNNDITTHTVSAGLRVTW